MQNILELLLLNLYALCLIGAISIVFFSKRRMKEIEDSTYAWFLVANMAISITGLILGVAVNPAFNIPNITIIVLNKLYLIALLSWILLLTFYTFYISLNNKKNTKKWENIFFAINVIGALLILILPTKVTIEKSGAVASGLSIMLTYSIFSICYLFQLIRMVIDHKNLKSKKYIPIYLLVLFGIIILIIIMSNPSLNYIINPVLIFIAFIMYFTIENPDVKMIEQLDMAKTQAEKANKAKTEFLSNMSHEIRTPLNAIVGFSECMLEQKDLGEETKGFAKDIVDASNNLLEIVNGILDISKIEANKMEIVSKEYNPREVFNSLCKLVKPRIGDKPIEFKYTCSEDLPGVLKGDVAKVKQIILNLLTNAAKYTDKGSIEFIVNTINRMDTKTSLLYISIKDTGRGIKKENIDKLFNKFERIDEDKNTTIEGTGLGLAITKSLVEMMGGRINVVSKYGEGSTFRVYLEQEIVSMEIPESNTEEIEIDYNSLKDKKILVVDDSKINLKVAQNILKPYHFDIVTAESGMEALEIAKTQTFDLILMDIMMPKMNGVECLNELKEIPGFNIPVVALTADAIEGTDEKYKSAGFDDYLSKPIDRYLLNKVLHKFLN